MSYLSNAHRQGYSQGKQTLSNAKLMTSAASTADCEARESQAPVGKGMSVATVKQTSLGRSGQAISCKAPHGNPVVASFFDLKGCSVRLASLLTGSPVRLQQI